MNHKIFGNADNISILESNQEDIERPAKTLKRETEQISQQVNEDKTQYVIINKIVSQELEPYSRICVDGKSFPKVGRSKFLVSIITSFNDQQSEIDQRIPRAHRAFSSLSKALKSWKISKYGCTMQ